MRRDEIETHLRAVGAELANQGLIGEIVLAGGSRIDALTPAYMFAMKAVAGRPRDLPDIEVLARHLGITSSEGRLRSSRSTYPSAC